MNGFFLSIIAIFKICISYRTLFYEESPIVHGSQHDFGQKKILAKWHHAPDDGGSNTRY